MSLDSKNTINIKESNDMNNNQKIIMKNMIKENEIISKVIKGKLDINYALNELLKILNEQRNYIENISEEHMMLEKSVTRLNTSIDILKTKLNFEKKEDLDMNKIINANKVQFKPNEVISFSKLNNNKIMNQTFNKKLKVPTKKGSVSSSSRRYISDTSSTNTYSGSGNIDYDKLIQMSVSDFNKKKKLKPIDRKK